MNETMRLISAALLEGYVAHQKVCMVTGTALAPSTTVLVRDVNTKFVAVYSAAQYDAECAELGGPPPAPDFQVVDGRKVYGE